MQAAIAPGVTASATATPLLVTFRAAVNTWPVLAVVTLGAKTPVIAAAVCTVTPGAVIVPVDAGKPLLMSTPLAVVNKVSVPAAADAHP